MEDERKCKYCQYIRNIKKCPQIDWQMKSAKESNTSGRNTTTYTVFPNGGVLCKTFKRKTMN